MSIEPLLSIDDVATLTHRSHWSLRKDVAAGRLSCIRLGTRILFEEQEVQRFIDQAKVGPEGVPTAAGVLDSRSL